MAKQSTVEKIDQSSIDRLGAPMELDLTAYFNIVEQEIRKIVDNADKYTEEELSKKIEGLFDG
jgi:hypothetical protein